jgi:hypothetical protein
VPKVNFKGSMANNDHANGNAIKETYGEDNSNMKNHIGYWPVQINGNKFATSQILQKSGRKCEGADFSWLSSKVSQNLYERGRLISMP